MSDRSSATRRDKARAPFRGRAALYARQSITREGSASLEVQIEACREAAARLKLDVIAELVEAPSTSGYRNRGRSRPKFGELLELIRRGEADCVVAYKTDRLSRGGGPGWAPLVDAFEAAGRDPDKAVATTDGWVSEFEIGIRSAMDREESKKTSDRMLAVRAREAKEGVPRVGGRRPFGYSINMSEHIDAEATLILDAADRVLRGDTLWRICSEWNDRNVPTVTGCKWTVQTLRTILTSARIAGLRTHCGEVVGAGRWEPIISEDCHHALVDALAVRPRQPRHGRTYPLTGLLVCGLCGKPLRSLSREGGRRSYACRKGPGFGGCGRIRIQAPGVERHVRDLICGMLADPVTRDALESIARESAHRGGTASELTDLERRRERLVDLYTEGDIDRATFRSRRNALDGQIRDWRAQLNSHLNADNDSFVGVPGTFDDLVSTWDTADIDQQRRLVTLLLDPVVVNPTTSRGRRMFDATRLQVTARL
jgi:DNA invertase Pin-like site-specific DNA recombinase